MKIVSLLPSATEIVFALGSGDQLIGRSFECDFPIEARGVPIVSGTALPADGLLSAAEIDAAVSERIAAGESIYRLDVEAIRREQPDVILAQDLCEVCAVPSGAVTEALEVIGCSAQVVSLDPTNLDEVLACVWQVGTAIGRTAEADALMESLRQRVEVVRDAVCDETPRRVFALEWSDPPFSAGHWVPDMIAAAGGSSLIARSGDRSARLDWERIAVEDPQVVVFMPCGYRLDRAVEEGMALLDRPELRGAEIWATWADAYFSRPGPRVVDGVEILAGVLHPGAVGPPDTSRAVRLR